MIIYFIFNIVAMVILSYFSESVPELFLVSIVLLTYKKDINKNYFTLFVLLGGYFTDVFYFVNYPIYTLSYYIIYLISFNYIKDYIIFDFLNLSRVIFVFIFLEKMVFMLFSLSMGLKIIIYRDVYSFVFEILSTILFLLIYYKFNSFIEGSRKSLRY